MMKRSIALILILCAAGVVPLFGKTADNLSLNISVTEGEHSKDSNSRTTTIVINGHELRYEKAYHGYRSNRATPVNKTIRLSDEKLNQLIALLKEKNLLVSNSIGQSTDGIGRYFIVNASLALGRRKSSIKISGMKNKLENEKLYQDFNSLLDMIESFLEE